ncbi:hypothetical protein ACTFIZ_011032 [Dictyostelium cf. discoideum]
MPEETLFALTHQYEQCLLLPTLDLGPHVYSNQQAILFEKIWHKRNKLIHDEIVLTIHKEQIIQELIKTQRAAWERTQSIISKSLRIKSKQRSEEQNKLDSLISQKLLQFSRQWNSPLHSITLPKHLKIYNNSLSSLYK